MVILVVFLGDIQIKYLFWILGIGVLIFGLFVLIAKAFPEAMPNRIDTWISRIENFREPTGVPRGIIKSNVQKLPLLQGSYRIRGWKKRYEKLFTSK